MSNNESLGLDEKKQEILEKFRDTLSDVLQPTDDDRYLLRWLRARNYDLPNAEKMFRENVKFRKERHVHTLTQWNTLPKELVAYTRLDFLGFDYGDHPVWLLNLGWCDCRGFLRCTTIRDFIDWMIARTEEINSKMIQRNKKLGLHVETGTFIFDLKNFNFREMLDRRVLRFCSEYLKVFQDNYPEALNISFMINAPKMFVIAFNVLIPFMSDSVISKTKFYGEDDWQEDLFSAIPKEIVPAYLGGTLYGPNQDPLCHDRLNWAKSVPTSLYMKNLSTNMDPEDPGTKKTVIRPRQVFEVNQMVSKVPALLTWEFHIKGYDIKFGISYSSPGEIKTVQDILGLTITDSEKLSEKGEHICKEPGIYTFTFDNKHSWFTAKHLLYNIQLLDMSQDYQQEHKT